MPISPNLFKITTELLLMMDRKSCMRFHMAPLSLTLSDLERSIQVTRNCLGRAQLSSVATVGNCTLCHCSYSC